MTPNPKAEDNLRNMPLFYAAKWCIADGVFEVAPPLRTKNQAAQGEALSGLVGEVLRGGGETLSTSTTD
jgi:hypothetical protein